MFRSAAWTAIGAIRPSAAGASNNCWKSFMGWTSHDKAQCATDSLPKHQTAHVVVVTETETGVLEHLILYPRTPKRPGWNHGAKQAHCQAN